MKKYSVNLVLFGSLPALISLKAVVGKRHFVADILGGDRLEIFEMHLNYAAAHGRARILDSILRSPVYRTLHGYLNIYEHDKHEYVLQMPINKPRQNHKKESPLNERLLQADGVLKDTQPNPKKRPLGQRFTYTVESQINPEVVEEVDAFLLQDGIPNSARFDYLFDLLGESLAYFISSMVPTGRDATLRHQIFDYWPTQRPDTDPNKKAWEGFNDLSWVLGEYAGHTDDDKTEDWAVWNEIRAYIEDYTGR